MREETKTNIALVMKYLRAGKSPKEIAFIVGMSWDCIRQIICRHQDVRAVYVDAYSLRYTNKPIPTKIIEPLRQQIVT